MLGSGRLGEARPSPAQPSQPTGQALGIGEGTTVGQSGVGCGSTGWGWRQKGKDGRRHEWGPAAVGYGWIELHCLTKTSSWRFSNRWRSHRWPGVGHVLGECGLSQYIYWLGMTCNPSPKGHTALRRAVAGQCANAPAGVGVGRLTVSTRNRKALGGRLIVMIHDWYAWHDWHGAWHDWHT